MNICFQWGSNSEQTEVKWMVKEAGAVWTVILWLLWWQPMSRLSCPVGDVTAPHLAVDKKLLSVTSAPKPDELNKFLLGC